MSSAGNVSGPGGFLPGGGMYSGQNGAIGQPPLIPGMDGNQALVDMLINDFGLENPQSRSLLHRYAEIGN